jgi:mannitol/fructose-specific phosphotransferase system IIA component (Ntr-type)
MKLTEIVVESAVIPELASTNRDEVLGEMVDALVASGELSADIRDEILAKLLEREEKGSTGFGRGVAVPHAKHPNIARLVAAVGLSDRGVDFASLDKQPVFSIFMLLSPKDQPEEHLQAMEVIFKNLSKENFRRFLRQAGSVEDVISLLDEADSQQLPG